MPPNHRSGKPCQSEAFVSSAHQHWLPRFDGIADAPSTGENLLNGFRLAFESLRELAVVDRL